MQNSTPAPKWYDKTWLVLLLCIVFFPVGLYALWKNSSMSKVWKIIITLIIALIVISQLAKDKKDLSSTSGSSSSPTEQKIETQKGVGIGQVLHTDYFDITVNSVDIKNKVSTGNQFADLKPESGSKLLIMNVSIKNTDKESRMPFDGSVWIEYNGTKYEYDKAETILLDGWGLLLTQLNPLITKTTNIVYKIPAEVKGPATWNPGRSSSDEIIRLGDIK